MTNRSRNSLPWLLSIAVHAGVVGVALIPWSSELARSKLNATEVVLYTTEAEAADEVNQAVAISSRNEGRYARGFHIEYRGQVQPAVNGFSDDLVLFSAAERRQNVVPGASLGTDRPTNAAPPQTRLLPPRLPRYPVHTTRDADLRGGSV